MKKYITIAALLTAGAAFANADTVNFNLVREDTTVSFVETSDIIELSYTSWAYTGGGNNGTGFQSPTNVAYQNTFSPDGQLRSGTNDLWTMTFSVANTGTESVTLQSFTFDAYGINGGGSDKNATIPVVMGLTDCASTDVTLAIGGATATATLNFSTPVVLNAGESKTLNLTMGSATSYNTYSGLTGGSVSYAIPEPSAFGLLAGLGALALVGARRRRR